MIIREYGTEKMVCDECDSSEHTIEGDFNSEVAVAKGEGWKISRPEGQWQHMCPDCAGSDGILAKARQMFSVR